MNLAIKTKPAYAIKTSRGYLARQGETTWFEDKPVGWALYTEEDYAQYIADVYKDTIGTGMEDGYSIEEVSNK